MTLRRRLRRAGGTEQAVASEAERARRDALVEMRDRGWVLPASLARDDVVPTWTRLGVVDGQGTATVDDRGLVTPIAGADRPSLDWWVGADDRWYLPAHERGVTQRRLDAAPVVETALRVPGGEVVHRAFGARGPAHPGGDEWIVVEVENRSAVPVALAWVVRPYGPIRASGGGDVTLTTASSSFPKGPRLLGAPEPMGLLSRPPSRWARSVDGADPVHQVVAGDAESGPLSAPDPDRNGPMSVALLTPLPHTATARVALFASPVDGAAVAGADLLWPERLPEAEAVVRGWTALAERGPRIVLPDPVLSDAVSAARRSLCLAHRVVREPATSDQEVPSAAHVITTGDGVVAPPGERMELLAALSWWGEADAVDRALVDWPRGQQRGGGFGGPEATALALRALAVQVAASGDPGPAAAWLPEVGGAIEALGRWARRPPPGADPEVMAEGLEAGSVLLAVLDQPDAAARVATHAAEVRAGPPALIDLASSPGRPPTPRATSAAAVAAARVGASGDALWTLLRSASATTTWSDPERWVGDDALVGARFLDAVARLLVGDGRDGPILVPWVPPEWWGLGWEVHGAPTRWGHLSYAARWHSGRPAILWELGDPLDGVGADVVLTAPGLDPAWRATERRGEALLMPVPPPVAVDNGSGLLPGGVAVAAPPRSVWRPQDPGPDAVPASGGEDDPGAASTSDRGEQPDGASVADREDGPDRSDPAAGFDDGGSFS